MSGLHVRRIAAYALALLIISTGFAWKGWAVPPGYLEPPPGADRPAAASTGLSITELDTTVSDTVCVLCPKIVKQFSPSYGGSDCWGWRDGAGQAYAIMGVADGVAFVNAETGVLTGFVPGPVDFCGRTRWRDIKTYQQYCYAVSECLGINQGLMIIDMQYLPDSVHLVGTFAPSGFETSHNLSIDTATGFAYLVNPGYDGFRVVSLSNPTVPSEYPPVITPGCHDIFARNDTVWVAEANAGSFSIWDMSDKFIPTLIQRVSIPAAGYVHNIWPSGDGRHLITTEETAGKTVKFWDVQDYSSVSLVGQYLADNDLAHNAHMVGDTAVISHYTSGVVMVDFSNPSAPTEIASYDTYSASETAEFQGDWGAYPYTGSNTIYASNLDNRLFVLEKLIVVTNDTLVGDTVSALAGEQVRLDIRLRNEHPIKAINVPISWSGDFDIAPDSVSTAGLRTEFLATQTFTAWDPANNRFAYALNAGSGAPLAAGEGPVLSLYFTLPPDAAGTTTLSLDTFSVYAPEVVTACVQYQAATVPGVITTGVGNSCCSGLTGNVNNDPQDDVDIQDLTTLVNFLFVTFQEPPCPAEANVSGDPSGEVDIQDLTALVNYLFVTFESPAACQ